MNLKCTLTLLLLTPAVVLPAQSNEAARTTIGISFGVLPATNLWDIPAQLITPISQPPNTQASWDPDTWHLRRDVLTRSPTFQLRGTRFVNSHLGVTVELGYYAFKTTDRCEIVQRGRGGDLPNADPALLPVCDSIPVTSQGSRSTLAAQGGVVLRPFSGSVIQPFVEGLAGFTSTSSSTAALHSEFGGTSLTIYRDPTWKNLHPAFLLGGGLSTELVRGLLARVAVRESWVAQAVVTGASGGQATATPIATRYKGFLNVTVGLDIVLKKQRGRRY